MIKQKHDAEALFTKQ